MFGHRFFGIRFFGERFFGQPDAVGGGEIPSGSGSGKWNNRRRRRS